MVTPPTKICTYILGRGASLGMMTLTVFCMMFPKSGVLARLAPMRVEWSSGEDKLSHMGVNLIPCSFYLSVLSFPVFSLSHPVDLHIPYHLIYELPILYISMHTMWCDINPTSGKNHTLQQLKSQKQQEKKEKSNWVLNMDRNMTKIQI